MKRLMISGATLALALAIVQPARAANSSKEEATGVGAGALIGAAAGGPPGAIIGAAIGGLIGDRYHDKKEKITQLDSQL